MWVPKYAGFRPKTHFCVLSRPLLTGDKSVLLCEQFVRVCVIVFLSFVSLRLVVFAAFAGDD